MDTEKDYGEKILKAHCKTCQHTYPINPDEHCPFCDSTNVIIKDTVFRIRKKLNKILRDCKKLEKTNELTEYGEGQRDLSKFILQELGDEKYEYKRKIHC